MSRASPSVYLAGPITGLNWNGATDWRASARQWLEARGILAFSPLRGKEYLAKEQDITGNPDVMRAWGQPLSTPKGICARDSWDVRTSSVVLMNLLGATRVSIGTMVELGWASAWRVPVILAMEGAPVVKGDNLNIAPEQTRENPHHHAMVDELADFTVPTLDEALHLVRSLLLP